MPDRHGRLRHRKSVYHAMSRSKCLSALVSIKFQIAIFGLDCKPLQHGPTDPDSRTAPCLSGLGRLRIVVEMHKSAPADVGQLL